MSLARGNMPVSALATPHTLTLQDDLVGPSNNPMVEPDLAPVIKEGIELLLSAQKQNKPSNAHTSGGWRQRRQSIGVAPNFSLPRTGRSNPSQESTDSSEDGVMTPDSSGPDTVALKRLEQKKDAPDNRPRSSSVSSAGFMAGDHSGASRDHSSVNTWEHSFVRIISHGHSTPRASEDHGSSKTRNKLDVFELLPIKFDSEGKLACQHHNDHSGNCVCQAFILAEASNLLDDGQSGGVCYPIREVDEPLVEALPKPKAVSPPPVVQTQTTAVPQLDETKLRQEAQRFDGLLEKLRRSAEEKCEKLIKGWKDPVTGCSEPPASLDREGTSQFLRRFEEYKKMVYTKYAPHQINESTGTSDLAPSSVARFVETTERGGGEKKASDGIKNEESPDKTMRRAWNPKAEEFQPPKRSYASVLKDPKTKDQPHAKPAPEGLRLKTDVSGGTKGPDVESRLRQSLATPRQSMPSKSMMGQPPGLYAGAFAPPAVLQAALTQLYGSIPLVPLVSLPIGPVAPAPVPSIAPLWGAGSGLPLNKGAGRFNTSFGAHVPGIAGNLFSGLQSGITKPPVPRPFAQTVPGVAGMPPSPTSKPPGPVPKPRFPNSNGQQAYEEWIEWRKANEPGYALECKARQARRVQRKKMAPKSVARKNLERNSSSLGTISRLGRSSLDTTEDCTEAPIAAAA